MSRALDHLAQWWLFRHRRRKEIPPHTLEYWTRAAENYRRIHGT